MTDRMFLAIGRSGRDVTVDIDTMLPEVPRAAIRLSATCSDEIAATLLMERLRQQRDAIVEATVAKAYADGYRDGRAKRGKRTWHPCVLRKNVP